MTSATGATILLPCAASGVPAPTIEWYKNQKHVSEDPGSERVTVHNNGSLEVRDVTEQDADVYTCRAYNLYGTAVVKHTLVIQGACRNAPRLSPASRFLFVPLQQPLLS